MDQFFGDALVDNDLLPLSYHYGFVLRPRTQTNINTSGKSELSNDFDDFTVSLDVSQFGPDELEVKVADDFLIVLTKHDERCDEHGFITRKSSSDGTCSRRTVNKTV